MKHGVKKVKFSKGQDAHQALVRKLLVNFLETGHLSTTLSKAKVLKSRLDRLTYKATRGTASDRNVLLKQFGNTAVVSYMLEVVGPEFSDQVSGYTKLYRLGPRQGDNAEIARLEWVKSVEPRSSTTKQSAQGKKVKVEDEATLKKLPKKTSSAKTKKI